MEPKHHVKHHANKTTAFVFLLYQTQFLPNQVHHQLMSLTLGRMFAPTSSFSAAQAINALHLHQASPTDQSPHVVVCATHDS